MLDPLRLLGVATASDRGQLNRWFVDEGQPNPAVLFAELNRQATPPFPTPDEAAIIAGLTLSTGKICVRPSEEKIRNDVLDAQVVAVACWDDKTPTPVYFYRYADPQRLAKDVGSGGARSCETNPPGFLGTARYSKPSGATGVLTCFTTESKVSVLVWSDDRTGVLAATAVPANPAKQAELIAWWTANVN
ncbi:hypothetical protein [Pseudonocardia spinosispora]|uniref:hypothetical protein n=1 Tax=Pseudonocardia spinosispora TaxID=103441 RepID=UPI00048C0A2E|nr:hypothetical protein [Pseudonocardia spinosispora]